MTDLTFEVNGTDFSALVHKNGIRTYLEPVYSGEITTLAKVRRRSLKRWRGILHVTLNDLAEKDSAALCAALMAYPLQVRYYCWQRRQVVTEAMSLDPFAREQLLRDAGERWIAGVTLKFEQD